MNVELILDEDEIYRRILDDWIKEDGRPSSAAFQNTSNTNDMSVNLARLTSPEKTVSEYPNCGVASFLAGFARELEQQVIHKPISDNLAHSTVRGKKNIRIRRKLVEGSTVILLPPNWKDINPANS